MADEKSVKSCVTYLTKNFAVALQLSLLRGSRAPKNVLRVLQISYFIQIGSLSAKLYPNA